MSSLMAAMAGEPSHTGFDTLPPLGLGESRTFTHFQQRPIVPALGAEISGIDLRHITAAAQAELREAIENRSATLNRLEADIASARQTLEQIREVRPVDVATAESEASRGTRGAFSA